MNDYLDYEDLKIGGELPSLTLPPISRSKLAEFGSASGDLNPIHVDIDFARAAGKEDVFAHGMLSMAYLGRLLTEWMSQQKLRQFKTRFLIVTQVHDQITCSGYIRDKKIENGKRIIVVEVTARNQNNEITLSGEAIFEMD